MPPHRQAVAVGSNTMTMHIRNLTLILFLLLSVGSIYAQKTFKVVLNEADTLVDSYHLVDEKGNIFRQLDTSKYYICFTLDNYGYFAVFGMKNFKGWAAIDADENVLFNVYNTSFGEPNPDYLIENKIRIVDTNNLIGFANNKGQVIIKPQFDIATSFNNGKAIIGQNCKKVPWDEHAKESDCHHYSITCKQHGYIDTKGNIQKLGKYSFDDIAKEINWKMPEE